MSFPRGNRALAVLSTSPVVINDNEDSSSPSPENSNKQARLQVEPSRTSNRGSGATDGNIPAAPQESRPSFPNPLCRRTTMVALLSKNNSSKNSESFSSGMVKEMLKSLLKNKDKIVVKTEDYKPELLNDMERALDCSCNTKTTKAKHANSLVDIWLVFKQVDELVAGDTISTRSNSMFTFIGAMQQLE